MPAYTFDFTTDAGARRLQFTLDDDRALAPQLFQVHEELNQRGLVIRGGPNDELAAFWNGTEVDATRTAQQLGLSPLQPIELRMRPAPSKAPARAPEPSPHSFVVKSWGVALLAGFFGALIAWTISAGLLDLGPAVDTYAELDGVVAVLLGVCVGTLAVGTEAWRESRNVPLAVLLGFVCGAFGGVLGAAAGGVLGNSLSVNASALTFVGVRVGAWALMSAAIGAAIALPAIRRDARRLMDGLLFGLVAGAIGGLVYCFPGPSDVWQLLAFLIVGGAVAAGASVPALQRASAILELETVRQRGVNVVSLREWGLDERSHTSIGPGAAATVVEWKNGRFAVVPPAGSSIVVSGSVVGTAIYLRNYDVIEIGDARYRFRRLRKASA